MLQVYSGHAAFSNEPGMEKLTLCRFIVCFLSKCLLLLLSVAGPKPPVLIALVQGRNGSLVIFEAIPQRQSSFFCCCFGIHLTLN